MTKKDNALQLTRREFVKASGAAIASATLFSVTGCAPKVADSEKISETNPLVVSSYTADETKVADVVVVGVGVAGLMACVGAADKGAKVIGIDRLSEFSANNTFVAGMWVAGSEIQEKNPLCITVEDAFKHINSGTHYQSNAKLLRNVIPASGRATDIISKYGILANPFDTLTDDSPMMMRASFFYTKYYGERGQVFQKMLDDRGVEMTWNSQVIALLAEDGVMKGIVCKDNEGKTTKIEAKAVVLSTGGFISDKEMVAKYFGGADIVPTGNIYCDGAGIKMAMAAGGQIGKNFTVSINECGGANRKASPAFPLAKEGFVFSNLFSFPLFGGLCVDRFGHRFMDESMLAREAMFTAEPINRESYYYYLFDETFMQKLRTEPVVSLLDPEMFANLVDVVKKIFEGKTWSTIDDEFKQAMDEGWAWKGNSIEELISNVTIDNLDNYLTETVDNYNAFCESGTDTEMYKTATYLTPLKQGPFYCIQENVSAFMTLGGIKCDQNCQALNTEGKKIPGLFVAGGDADLWAVPYYQGGTCSGFSLGSGLIAGENAAAL